MSKRVTNECIQRELGHISASLKSLRHDLEDIKEIAPRVRSLEVFRSYIKGVASVTSLIGVFVYSLVKGVFGNF